MKVLVLGAGGFLGSHIVHQLLASDHEVYAGIRPQTSVRFDPQRTIVMEGDLDDIEYVRRALRGMDAVIFSAGRTWSPGVDIAEYRRVNLGITQVFFDAVREQPNLRVVFTSSTATVGGTKQPIVLTEDSGRSAVHESGLNPYDYAKIECEGVALQYARSGGNVVILNPGVLLGPAVIDGAKLPAPLVILWVCQRKCPLYADARVAFSDVRDVAMAHVNALTLGQSGNRYLVVSDNLYRSEFYRRLSRLTGTPRPHRIPCGLVYASSVFTDLLSWATFGKFKSPVHRHFARTQRLHYCGDSSRAQQELGFLQTSVDKTIVDTVQYYVRQGMLPKSFDFLHEATVENVTSLLLLYQWSRGRTYSHFAAGNLARLYETVQNNQILCGALTTLLRESRFSTLTGRYRFPKATCHDALKTLENFCEYVYLSSDEFLQSVS